ncbi:MAG: DUF2887 domain-containing protein [Cyanobacteria bacterium P01_C01_bin.120]
MIRQPVSEAQCYRFASKQVKQTAIRLDGVLLLPSDRTAAPPTLLIV